MTSCHSDTDPPKRVRMTASERDGLQRMMVAMSILEDELGLLTRRTGLIKQGKSYVGMARAMVRKWYEAVLKTVPGEQLPAVQRTLLGTSYTIGVKCTATMNNEAKRHKEYAICVSQEAMRVILGAAREHCTMCGLDKEGQRRCELRKALDSLPNDSIDRDDGGCQYYEII